MPALMDASDFSEFLRNMQKGIGKYQNRDALASATLAILLLTSMAFAITGIAWDSTPASASPGSYANVASMSERDRDEVSSDSTNLHSSPPTNSSYPGRLVSQSSLSSATLTQCADKATITGTDEADVIKGTPSADIIDAKGGDDTVYGFGGDDIICGGDGRDKIHGGGGVDTIYGNGERDFLYGGFSADILYGGYGNDSVNGGNGNDQVYGGQGDDQLAGDDGNDSINSVDNKKNNDSLDGGTGTDECVSDPDPETNCEGPGTSPIDVVWYGTSVQDVFYPNENDAVVRLKDFGLIVEHRSERPIKDLDNVKVVVIKGQYKALFSAEEVQVIKQFVNNGGKLILATDTDYFRCNPDSTCAMEIAREFGFAFKGDVNGLLTPAEGQSNHPIWTSPNKLSSFGNWCCDAFVGAILDPKNVKALAVLEISGTTQAGIVVNENPNFEGGKVMGLGYNMLVGLNGDFRMFDNVMSFVLDRTLGS